MTDFIDGLIVKEPHPNAPDFVKAKISIKREELIQFLQSKSDDWLNADIKVSKSGKWYAMLDDWKPSEQAPSQQSMSQSAPSQDFDDDIPFS